MSSVVQTFSQREDFILSGVSLERCIYKCYAAIQMTMPRETIKAPEKEILTDRNFTAWLPLDFCDGEIELWVASELVIEASDYSRRFIGLTFRIDESGHFESIYLPPTNSLADDQQGRNHSVQYLAFPNYRFDRLRLESPEKYETYAQLELARCMHMRIDVKE